MWKSGVSLVALAILLFPAKLLADAKADYQEALDKYRNCRFEEAKGAFERFCQLYPQDENMPGVLYRLAELEPNPGKALAHCETILSQYPRSGVADSALFRIGLYRMASAQYAGAGEAFTDLLTKYPNTPLEQKVRYWLGLSYLARQDRISAIGELREVVKISSESQYGLLAKRDLERMESAFKPSSEKKATPEVSPGGAYLVQVGSFADFEAALRLRRRLEGKGYPVSFSETVAEEQPFYRVRVGPYLAKDQAREVGERLAREERLECWIVKRQL